MRLTTMLGMVLLGLVGGASPAGAQPAVDHHLHFLRSMVSPPPGVAMNAAELIRQMDAAGVKRGVVLSLAYQFGNPFRAAVANEYERVKEENDWTAEQAGLYPERLVAFCGVNPLKEYALAEIERCAGDARLRRGLKLHFGNSDVEMDKPGHVEQVRRVFAAANRRGMAIVAHVRPNIDHGRPWGAKQARMFLEQVLPEAPDVVVQIAHLASAGRYEDEGAAQAMGVFAEAVAGGDRRARRLYFDVSVVSWEGKREVVQRLLRAVGVERLLYASDGPPVAGWKVFQALPLSAEELRRIAENVAPYLR